MILEIPANKQENRQKLNSLTVSRIPFLFSLLAVLCMGSLSAMGNPNSRNEDVQVDVGFGESPFDESQDAWYGPGFYYGIWFNNEGEYWDWRQYHRDYPYNRYYYQHSRPYYYYHKDRRDHHSHHKHH